MQFHSEVLYKKNIGDVVDKLNFNSAEGLSAIYRNVSNSIDLFHSDTKKNVCIIITAGKDNSSLTFDVNDLVEIAKANDTEIYTVGIGEETEPYVLKYISNQTGGSYYSLDNSNVINLMGLCNEVQYMQYTNYDLEIVYEDNMNYLCETALITVSLDSKEEHFVDEVEYSYTAMPLFSIYQAIAAFQKDAIKFEPQYENNIRLLGDILIANPEVAIQIIGNSFGSVNNEQVALDRAIYIYKGLKNYGVNPTQLRFKSRGNSYPLYFMTLLEWQDYLNNRVEIKWLAPSLYPYEIIAESYPSEDEAFNRVLEWETQGFDAYYERYFDNAIPRYRVRLWGFQTESDANKAINLLKKNSDFNYILY
jgi:outer membrane protein OmpA-like peptidoglycan-associated protein